MPTPEEVMAPYRSHGMDFVWRPGQSHAYATCPFCNKERHFALCVEPHKSNDRQETWRCLKCISGTGKGGGNLTVFFRMLADKGKATPGQDYVNLVRDRKLHSPQTLVKWGVVRSAVTGEWLVPGYNVEGALCQFYAYRRDQKSGKNQLRGTAGLPQHLTYAAPLPKKYGTVYVCYSDDTEVLTRRGWVLFSNLTPEDEVAAYSVPGGVIHYEVPKARQKFYYKGEMIHFKTRWSELLVTPDHRMLYRWPAGNQELMVKPAGELGRNTDIPTAGMFGGGVGGPTVDEVRLLVAFTADGCVRRGHQIEFGLTKERKRKRIREILTTLGITYQSHFYGDREDREYLTIDRRDAPFLLRHCPDKQWTDEVLTWSTPARQALLCELGFWDGDFGKKNVRFFTSKWSEADIISRLAVLSGWSSQMKVNRRVRPNRPGRKTDCGVEYVLNLLPKSWRRLTNKSGRASYRGDVYCVTTSTGFVVVRRKGKAVVSGNCEGPWDGMALWESFLLSPEGLKDIAVISVPGLGSVGEPLVRWSSLLEDCRVVLMFDNDHPGEITIPGQPSRQTAPAAFEATKKATALLKGMKKPPKEGLYLSWGEGGYDGGRPHGFDVRDFLSEEPV